MRTFPLARNLALQAMLLLSTSAFAQNLVTNGDFESRPQAPRGLYNIAPVVTPSFPYDDLPSWYRTATSTSTDAVNNFPNYVATDGAFDVNTATYFDYYRQQYGVNFAFAPHMGRGCVALYQHDSPADHKYDAMITQKLAAPLLRGHIYQVDYWVLRLASNKFRTELALSVTGAIPTFDGEKNTYILNPSPGNKIVLSGDIQDTQNWTHVSGQITIPAGESTNQWITIGYASTNPRYDPSLPDVLPGGAAVSGTNYAVDDISIKEVGCASILSPQVVQDDPENWRNKNQALFGILNREPGVNYTITNIQFANPTAQPGTTGSGFIVKGGSGSRGPVYYGYFTITADNGCTSITSDPIEVEYRLGTTPGGRPASSEAATAYPNPAAESITIPEGAEGATLVNDKGKTLRTADASGKLDVQSLPDGLYNLQMRQDGKLINKRIQVKH